MVGGHLHCDGELTSKCVPSMKKYLCFHIFSTPFKKPEPISVVSAFNVGLYSIVSTNLEYVDIF